MDVALLVLYTIALLIIGALLYSLFQQPKKTVVYNEIPPPALVPTHWWGYGWRPWWRRYNGLPGVGKPLPPPKMPKPPKPIVV